MKPLPVVLVTGFLGAGKTTFVNEMLTYLKQKKKMTALLINEFGKINIDAELVKNGYAPIYEVNQGSIFCVCTREQFISAVSEIVDCDQNYEMLIIEATGIADPANLEEYFELPSLADRVNIVANFCIIDAANFHKVQETLPAVTSQVKAATTCIINKVDLVESNYLSELEQQLRKLNQKAQFIKTSYGIVNFNHLLSQFQYSQWLSRSQLKKAPPEAVYTVSLEVEGVLDLERVKEFLEKQICGLLRGKGFLKLAKGWYYIEFSGGNWEIYQKAADRSRQDKSQIVLIGGKMDEKELQTALEDCLI